MRKEDVMTDLELAREMFYLQMIDSWSDFDRARVVELRAEMELRGIRVNNFSITELTGVQL
jgi:hypothetical protein